MQSRYWLIFGVIGSTSVVLLSIALTSRPTILVAGVGVGFVLVGAIFGRVERFRTLTTIQEAQIDGERPKWGWVSAVVILLGVLLSKIDSLPVFHDLGITSFFAFCAGYFGYIATRTDLTDYMDDLQKRLAQATRDRHR